MPPDARAELIERLRLLERARPLTVVRTIVAPDRSGGVFQRKVLRHMVRMSGFSGVVGFTLPADADLDAPETWGVEEAQAEWRKQINRV